LDDQVAKYPKPYLQFLLYFHADRDFFECHEVLEQYWKTIANSPMRLTWHGFIQVAVSLYHQRRGNLAGARKMMNSALVNLQMDCLMLLGINGQLFLQRLQDRALLLQQHPEAVYEDMNIPLNDRELSLWCEQQCSAKGLTWQAKSNLSNVQIIHKHTLRDRTAVVKERLRMLSQKGRFPSNG